MQKWHPDVLSSVLETKADPDGKAVNYRTLTLKNGGTIIEKQREMQAGEMKLGALMEQGDNLNRTFLQQSQYDGSASRCG